MPIKNGVWVPDEGTQANGPNRQYDNGLMGPGQNEFQREAGNFTRNTPGFGYQGLGEDYFRQLADQYGKRGSPYANMAQQWLGNNDTRQTAEENDALAQLKLAASGAVPSVAEQQMARGMQQSVRDAASQAAGARGGPGAWAAANRVAAGQQAGAQQDIIGQTGIVRANEMAQARGAYADAAARQRAGNLSSLGLNFQTGLGLGGLGNQAEGQNIQALLALYGYGQGAAGRQQAGQQAYNEWLANEARHSSDRNADQGNKYLGAGMSAAGALMGAASDERLKTDIKYVGEQKPDPEAEAQKKRMQAMGQGFQQAGSILSSDIAMKKDIKVEGSPAPYSSKKGDADPLALLAASGRSDAAMYRDAHPQGYPQAYAVYPGGVQHAFGEAQPAGRGSPSQEMLEAIVPASFTYKADPSGQRRFGVMAQDLEKSPMGASLVRDTPDGKMVDAAQGTMAALHALADMHERVKRLEGTKQEKR